MGPVIRIRGGGPPEQERKARNIVALEALISTVIDRRYSRTSRPWTVIGEPLAINAERGG